jgi:hypothetical protein
MCWSPGSTVQGPDVLGQFQIELAALLHLSGLEGRHCLERQASLPDKAQEPGVVLITLRVQGASEEILAIVVRQLFLVSQITVAGVETLGQEQQATNPITRGSEVAGMSEFIRVSLCVVGPDMLDLVPFFP